MQDPYLDVISHNATGTATNLYRHSWGVPIIPKAYSLLSAHEQEILLLNEELSQLSLELKGVYDQKDIGEGAYREDIEELEKLLGNLKTRDLFFNLVSAAKEIDECHQGQQKWDQRVCRLDEAKIELDSRVTKEFNDIRSLTEQLRELEEKNSRLHEGNKQLVQEIQDKSVDVKKHQEEKFTSDERIQYDDLKQLLIRTKTKSDVICELILALILATGINWAKDSKLKELVEACGCYLLEKNEFLFEEQV